MIVNGAPRESIVYHLFKPDINDNPHIVFQDNSTGFIGSVYYVTSSNGGQTFISTVDADSDTSNPTDFLA